MIAAALPVLLIQLITLSGAGLAQGQSVRGEMLVSTSWLADRLQDADVVVLCVAENSGFYSENHIPGARLISLADIVTERHGIPNELPSVARLRAVFEKAGVSNRSRIVLYGERSGLLAARAYFTLDYLGLADRAALLDGGIEVWRAEGRAESKDVPRVLRQQLRLRPNPKIIVTTEQVRASLTDAAGKKAYALIDGRPREEFTGERRSERISQPGHISGAISLYWKDNLVSTETPVLRPVDELKPLYRAAEPAGEMVTYCRTGMQSSFDYFVAKYLGYNVRMYDASVFEWDRKGLRLETSPASK